MSLINRSRSRDVIPPVDTLPHFVTCKEGHQFDPRGDTWVLRELTLEVTLRFHQLTNLGEDFKVAYKAALAWYAQDRSVGTVKKVHNDCRMLFLHKAKTRGIVIVEITSVDLVNYKAHLGSGREYRLAAISAFLKRWHALGYPGVTKDAVTILKQLRFKGNRKGVAVATMDPIHGPFTALEHEALQQALGVAYAQNDVTLAEYVLCWLFIALGMRPTQYARLKVCDIVQFVASDGSSSYSVRMPRAKQRGSERGHFTDRLLTPWIGRLVFEHARRVESQFTGMIDEPTQAPLFPDERIAPNLGANACHQVDGAIGRILAGVLERLDVISERTGEPLKIHSKRFRQTIGTRAAEEGHGELVIAELLDHSDTQSVEVYVQSTPAIVARIDRAVAMQLAPLAQAFAGKLIDGPSEASRHDNATNQIRAPAVTGTFDVISSCGKHGFCGFLKPVACYTCNSFEPWLDGPHERVLEHLLAERERLRVVCDARIASINDRAILAVAEVIQCCEAKREQNRGGHG